MSGQRSTPTSPSPISTLGSRMGSWDLPQGDNRPPAYHEGDLLVVRASALGSCLWELIACAQGHEPSPPPERLQRAFDEGHAAEPVILARLEKDGWKLRGAQKEGNLKVGRNRVVRYHLDSLGMSPSDSQTERVVEAKALSDSNWLQAQRNGIETLYEYGLQMSTMQWGEGTNGPKPGVWVALNKGGPIGDDGEHEDTPHKGELLIQFIDRPIHSLAEIVQRIRAVADGVAEGDVVMSGRPCDDPSQYPCRFLHLRPEEEPADKGPVTLDPEVWASLAADYDAQRVAEAKAKKAKERARDEMKRLAREAAGAGDGDPTPELISDEWEVVWEQGSRFSLDESAMAIDGINVGKYKTEKMYESIKVKRR